MAISSPVRPSSCTVGLGSSPSSGVRDAILASPWEAKEASGCENFRGAAGSLLGAPSPQTIIGVRTLARLERLEFVGVSIGLRCRLLRSPPIRAVHVAILR